MANSFSEFLRPHRTIPKTPWSAPSRWAISPLRVLVLVLGLFVFGLGEAFLLQSGIGNSPWTVLAEGVSLHFAFPVGVLGLTFEAPLQKLFGDPLPSAIFLTLNGSNFDFKNSPEFSNFYTI